MDRRKINLAFIRLEHFLEQCVKLSGPHPPPLPTPEMAKNIRNELVYLLDNVPEMKFEHVPSVTEVLANARLRNIPGIHQHSEAALREFLNARSDFIRRADDDLVTEKKDQTKGHISSRTTRNDSDINQWRKAESNKRREEYISQRLHENNPNITDLSDMNSPTKILDRFNGLYAHTWTDAYEELVKLYKHDINCDQRTTSELATILKKAFEYTEEMAEIQRMKIVAAMKYLMLHPSKDSDSNVDINMGFNATQQYFSCMMAVSVSGGASRSYQEPPTMHRGCLKEHASLSVPGLIKNFSWEIRKEHFRDILQMKNVRTYAEKCVEITWFMNVQDPAMCLIWLKDAKKGEVTSMFKHFTRTGNEVNFEVWPALLLTKEGPLMAKGVAQFK